MESCWFGSGSIPEGMQAGYFLERNEAVGQHGISILLMTPLAGQLWQAHTKVQFLHDWVSGVLSST